MINRVFSFSCPFPVRFRSVSCPFPVHFRAHSRTCARTPTRAECTHLNGRMTKADRSSIFNLSLSFLHLRVAWRSTCE